MQMLVTVPHVLFVHVSSKKFSARCPPPLSMGMSDPKNTHLYPTCVIMPNLVVLGQTVRASVGGPKEFWERRTLTYGAFMTPEKHALTPYVTMPNLTAVGPQ